MPATLLRRFHFHTAEGFEPDLDLDRSGPFIALRSKDGIRIALTPRCTGEQLPISSARRVKKQILN